MPELKNSITETLSNNNENLIKVDPESCGETLDTCCRKEKTSLYGGQAVIEGVMMKGPERTVVAVRKSDGKIVHKILREGEAEKKRNFWYKTPFLRGFLVLVDSLSVGFQALMFSGEVADPDQSPRNPVVEYATLAVSLVFALVIFKFVPILLALGIFKLFHLSIAREDFSVEMSVLFSAIEGIFKAGVLIGYILSIRLWREVRRVFQYHGAEHKTINAYEAGENLTIDEVASYPTFHPRCGTSFLFAVILISLIIAMMFPLITLWVFGDPKLSMNMLARFGMHIVFLPIISSLGYEFIRFTARFDPRSLFIRAMTYPGKLFQRITAIEPEKDMIEVALVSMHLAMGLPNPYESVEKAAAGNPDAEKTDAKSVENSP